MDEQFNFTFACGPSTLTVTNFNYTIATQLYGCGMGQQSYSQENSANPVIKLSFASIITIILALMATLILA